MGSSVDMFRIPHVYGNFTLVTPVVSVSPPHFF